MSVKIVSNEDMKKKEMAVAKAVVALNKLIALRALEVKVAEGKAKAKDKKRYAAMRRAAWKQAHDAYDWVQDVLLGRPKRKPKAKKPVKKKK